MNLTNLSIRLIEDNGCYDVLIRVDDAFASEFGEEFVLKITNDNERSADSLREHIRSKFPDKKLRRAKIILHGITIATIPIPTKSERLAKNTRHLGLVSTFIGSAEPEDTGVQLQDYKVKHGDTLWIIAAKFNTTKSELSKINNLTDTPETGRRISVPLNPALEE